MNSRPCHAELAPTLRLCLLVMPALLACSGGDPPSAPDTRGGMSIRVDARGLDYPAAFRVLLNTNFTFRDIKPNETAFLASLRTGTYSVEITLLPPNCTASKNSQTVNVEAGGSVAVVFDVTCVAMFGALRVSLTTSGIDLDPTGYRLELSSGRLLQAQANGTFVFTGIPGGPQVLELGGIASNCSPAGSATQALTISVGGLTRDTASASFSVTCSRTEKFAFRRVYPPNAGYPHSVDVSYADGSENISMTGGFAPAWSPDGNSLAFGWLDCYYYYYYGCSKSGLAAMNFQTGSFILLTADTTDSDPAWRPTDGAVIAFGRRGALYTVNAGVPNGTATRLVLPQSVRKASQPSWSPDALKLAFACELDEGGQSDICVIGADGSSFVRLTNDVSVDGNPEWSPDGRQIAFSTSEAGLEAQIALMSSAGGAITKLTPGKNPAWSRDGTKILFEGAAGASTRGISMITLASGTVTRLTTGDDHDPAWRP